MEKILEISLLFDFYGELLTQKQIEVFELYYNDDLSLGEIAQDLQISRQGVYDILKRGENLLYKYDQKLGLVEKFLRQKRALQGILEIISEIEKQEDLCVIKDRIEKIKKISSNVIEES